MAQTSIIGLALGGGAFRGVVHLGILKALEEEGLQPGFISGTSAGALAAAFYAFGMPPEDIRDLARKLRWIRVSNLTLPRLGLLSNAEIGRFVEKHLGEVRIEEAPIPLAILATDVTSGEKVVFKTGKVSTAIMASTCIPGVFIPVKEGKRMLVDGALVENVPMSVLSEMGARVRIGVDLGSGSYRKPENIVEVMLNSFAIAIDKTSNIPASKTDMIIRPELDGYSFIETGNSLKLYAEGYRCGIMSLDQIREVISHAEPSSFEVVEAKFRSWLEN